MMKLIVCTILLVLTLEIKAQSSFEAFFSHEYTVDELRQDLKVLKDGLEKIHPGLYRYSSREKLDSLFDQAQDNLKEGLTYQGFYRQVCRLVAQVKCQHTVAVPQSGILNQILKEGSFFPLKTFWEFETTVKAYSIFDFSMEASLPPGTRIISINGKTVESLYEELIPYFSSDGDILTNKQSRLQVRTDLQVWYYLLIGRPETFEVEMEDDQERRFSKTYESLPMKKLSKNYKKYNSRKSLKEYTKHYLAKGKKERSRPIRFEFLSEEIALLTINNFYSHKFTSIVSKAFEKIKEENVKNLIIDLRYNGGGSDILGRNLFSYLIDKPTPYFDSLYTSSTISDTTFLFRHTDKNSEWYKQVLPLVVEMEDGRYATKPEVNKGLQLQLPAQNSFAGNTYVLMNGRSASTTAEFTAATHFNKRAVFIGEESGGAYHGGHGGDFANLRLPNTKIAVQIPLTKYVMNSSEKRFIGRGTLPDYSVTETVQDFVSLKDPHLELVLKLIREADND